MNTEGLDQFQLGILEDFSHLPWKIKGDKYKVIYLTKDEDLNNGIIFVYLGAIEYYSTSVNDSLEYPGVYQNILVSEIEKYYKLETCFSNFR